MDIDIEEVEIIQNMRIDSKLPYINRLILDTIVSESEFLVKFENLKIRCDGRLKALAAIAKSASADRFTVELYANFETICKILFHK